MCRITFAAMFPPRTWLYCELNCTCQTSTLSVFCNAWSNTLNMRKKTHHIKSWAYERSCTCGSRFGLSIRMHFVWSQRTEWSETRAANWRYRATGMNHAVVGIEGVGGLSPVPTSIAFSAHDGNACACTSFYLFFTNTTSFLSKDRGWGGPLCCVRLLLLRERYSYSAAMLRCFRGDRSCWWMMLPCNHRLNSPGISPHLLQTYLK